jgi:hypothetical protein
MTIKVALLKSGEDVIADVQEMIVEEKVVGYFFNKPCVVRTRKSSEDETGSFQISLFPWIPITKQTKIPVINDWVITIVDPIDDLQKMYEKDVLKK